MGTKTTAASSHRNATEQQRARVLERLERGPASSLDLRRELDVLHPAGRIKELRRRGHSILMRWVERQTDCGEWHRVGLYMLRHQ